MCLELACSPLRMLRNSRCEVMFSQIRNIVYELTLRLYPIRGWSADFNDLFSMYGLLNSGLEDKLQNLLSALSLFSDTPEFDTYMYFYVFGDTSTAICNMNLFRGTNDKYIDKSYYMKDEENFFEVDLKFHITDMHSLDDIVQLAADLQNDTLDISLNMSAYKFEVQKRDFGPREYSQNNTFRALNFCSASTEAVSLSKQNTCPLISLSLDNNDCFEYKDGVICPTINITLNVSEYHFSTNGSDLFVCSDIYMNHSAHFIRERKTNNISSPNASVILSLVCTIISLVCLAISFMTFCLFPKLRTLPGKNNMSLILTLIIAQAMFLVSSFAQLESGSLGCKIVGVLTHFVWLAAIFWMNICTFHVFRVFTSIEALSVDSDLKSFVMYSAYALALPVCLVVINVVVSLVSSDMAEFGYGKSTCYISSEKMVGFTFGIPVGFVIITNLMMFAFFIYKIKTAPVVKKDVKNERNDIIIFAKLSTLTGFTWIFGFIYSWTDIELFSYLFIILNATQGVLLFLSFVCNKRVINRSFGVTSSSDAYRTRTTESTKQSSVRKV